MNFKVLMLLGLVLTTTLFSCKKDDDENVLTASMSATINDGTFADDGVTFNTTASNAWTSLTRVTVMTNNVITIAGTSLLGDAVDVTIYGTTEGTYNLGIANQAIQCGCALLTTYNNARVTFASTSGTVVLTKVDTNEKVISGTFSFVLYSGGVFKTITNGNFENLKYTKQ
jgi:hypothetical protein